MNTSKKPVIAVVTALANGYSEKELLRGIIAANKSHGCLTAVFSNIYNTVETDEDLLCEQRIYDLAASEQISGIIVLCESFADAELRRRTAEVLKNCHVPLIGVGARLDEFEGLGMEFLNTSDTDDIYELTSHLIEKHGFTDIAMLTGMDSVEVSGQRVDGYLRALWEHGIEPDMGRVHYGDFWLNSGEALAMRYVSGELPMPQAVVCANDMMAYGMLRCFSEKGIRVPEQITVISYEYSDRRMYYSPPLTSMRRNLEGLGRLAAERMHCMTEGSRPPEFIPPRGRFVFGRSCSCPEDTSQALRELRTAEQRKNYSDLGLFSTMEHKLALCRDMEEFVRIISEHHWMIQHKSDILLCLYSDWYDHRSDCLMTARSMIYRENSGFETDSSDLRSFFGRDSEAAVCYFSPLFSGKNYFGHIAMLYRNAESYDDAYRHWLKSISIGLEFLRLKNDIRYLLDCQNVSEYRDTLTGLNNEKGMERAYRAVRLNEGRRLCLLMLRTELFPRQFSEADMREKTQAVLGTARAVSEFCGSSDVSGRMNDGSFVCLVQSAAPPEMVSDLLCSVLIQEKSYMEHAGMSSFVCSAEESSGREFGELVSLLSGRLDEEYSRLAAQRRNRYYAEMLSARNRIYASPALTFEPDCMNISSGSADLFRRNYKECFGITFHQDCISARLAKAKYHLFTSLLSITDISEKCGYIDNKYFQRQFTKNTGIPPLRYRELMKA